jgi:hypothetical protein
METTQMMRIKRLGRRSFEVFKNDLPIGIVRFQRDPRQWIFRKFPSAGETGEQQERRGLRLRQLLCANGERCTVERMQTA